MKVHEHENAAERVFRTMRRRADTLGLGLALAYGGGLWLHLIHELEGAHEVNVPGPVLHWLRDSSLALPAILLAVYLAVYLARLLLAHSGLLSSRRVAMATAAVSAAVLASAVFGLGTPVHGWFFEAQHSGHVHEMPAAVHVARDSMLALVALLPLSLIGVELRFRLRDGRRSLKRQRHLSRRMVLVLGSTFLPLSTLVPAQTLVSTTATAAAPQCTSANAVRRYDVLAINVHIPYNRWGDINENGQLFVLSGDKSAVQNWHVPFPNNAQGKPDPALDTAANGRRLRPRPLVLRANAGECIEVKLTNQLNAVGGDGLPNNPRVSIEVRGPSWSAQTSAGSAVGYNDDTTIAIGQSITYHWLVPEEGLYLFRDGASQASSEGNGGSAAHGLYGALAVEPPGSTWADPESGLPVYKVDGDGYIRRTNVESGDPYIEAMIDPATGKSFRESIQLAQDEIPHGFGMGFNYGAEPGHHREVESCPDCIGEETSLSSWAYGDPALIKLASGLGAWKPMRDPATGQSSSPEDCGLPTSCYVSNVTHAYPGDPFKLRYGLAGVKETHVFHLHAHQWLREPKDVGASGPTPGQPSDTKRPESLTIDSQSFGPGETYTADLLFGAGSRPGTVGDSIFHCHLYPHFAEGFWALLRVHDVYEDGSQSTPDGIRVRAVKPLNDRSAPAAPTADNPGYPRFIPGKSGWRAPQPPLTIAEQSGQPDNPSTLEREDLTWAKRIVAGKEVTAADTVVEQGVQQRWYGGSTPKQGSPLVDPCPAGSREITYNVSVIQVDLVYNERGDHNTQGRIMVLDKDVEAVLSGQKAPEPLFIRVNSGDCINYNLTNRVPNWFGNDAFVKLAQTNMLGGHIHLVKFDVLGSDGSSNGWNYQQAAFSKMQADYNAELMAGTKTCTVANCKIPLPDPSAYDPRTKTSVALHTGQTIRERWFADYELRTVFTHDHHFPALDQNRGYYGALLVEPKGMDFRHPSTGQFYQPINSSGNGTVCGTACIGSASGTAMDVIGPGTNDDFREFGLAIEDFVPLTRAGGNPQNAADVLNPPSEGPEHYPDEDPGVMGINYRNAPFQVRDTKNGVPIDPAYRFSSTHYGDPKTPLLQAYSKDPVRLRVIQGSQEEQHVFTMHGIRWREEVDDPQSPYVNAMPVGISEAFNFEVPQITCSAGEKCQGDYLYGATGVDDLYLGAWGLMRVHGTTFSGLQPLPDNQPPRTPPATSATSPCPSTAPVRSFNVVAMDARLDYNEFGDHDPYGLIYALAEDEAAIRASTKRKEPLVMRANEGDCIVVTLTNKIDPNGPFATQHAGKGTADGDAHVPLEPPTGTRAGLRVSLHPQLLTYDVRYGDGATIGYNQDQTVGPGETTNYRWYAEDVAPGEMGAINLTNFGDVRGHRHHGLFAALIVEPKGATYHDPYTGAAISSGVAADIRVPNLPDFREFNVFFQDGLNLRDRAGTPIPDAAHEEVDAEDSGEKAFNYANAPFKHRLGMDPMAAAPDGTALAHVFRSHAHGDPRTPIFRAYAGDAVRVRVLQGADKPRQHSFQLAGHAWKAQPDDPDSTLIGTQGAFSVGRTVNVHVNAGGTLAGSGDFRYGSGVFSDHQSGGLWGIMRVYTPPTAGAAHKPTPLLTTDNPYTAGNAPLMPLEPSIDSTPPTITATPAGGTYSTAQSVTLSANEPATIYYTTDGSDPTTGSPQYSAPINIAATTTLKYIGKDAAGNVSALAQQVYTISSAPPPPPAPTNLLANGSFELDASPVDGKPDTWTTHTKFTRSNASFRTGSYAGQHFDTANGGHTIYQQVNNLAAGATYEFTGWVNIPATSDAFTYKIDVQWRNASGSTLKTDVVKSYTASTSGWNQALKSLVAPTGTTNARVRLVVSSLNATIYVDDMSIVRK